MSTGEVPQHAARNCRPEEPIADPRRNAGDIRGYGPGAPARRPFTQKAQTQGPARRAGGGRAGAQRPPCGHAGGSAAGGEDPCPGAPNATLHSPAPAPRTRTAEPCRAALRGARACGVAHLSARAAEQAPLPVNLRLSHTRRHASEVDRHSASGSRARPPVDRRLPPLCGWVHRQPNLWLPPGPKRKWGTGAMGR